MTHYGTLRAWAFIATLVGVLRDDRCGDRDDRVGVRGRAASGRRSACCSSGCPVSVFIATLPDRARPGACARSRTSVTRSRALADRVADVSLARASNDPTRSSSSEIRGHRSSTSATSPSGGSSPSPAGAGRRTCGRRSAGSGARRATSGSSSPGRLGIDFSRRDDASMFGPDDVFDIPPGHDGYTIGDEPCVQIEWAGIRAWAGFPTGHPQPRPRDAALHRPRRLDGARRSGSATRAGASCCPSHFEAAAGRARALRRARGQHDRRRDARDVRRAGAARSTAPRRSAGDAARESLGRSASASTSARSSSSATDVRGVAVHEAARIMARPGPARSSSPT